MSLMYSLQSFSTAINLSFFSGWFLWARPSHLAVCGGRGWGWVWEHVVLTVTPTLTVISQDLPTTRIKLGGNIGDASLWLSHFKFPFSIPT